MKLKALTTADGEKDAPEEGDEQMDVWRGIESPWDNTPDRWEPFEIARRKSMEPDDVAGQQ